MSSRCELCGWPMPPGEEVFKYHGYSCKCPSQPIPKDATEAVAEYIFRNTVEGQFWLDIKLNGTMWQQLQFETATERQRAHDDLMQMMRSLGAKDLPLLPQ